MLFQGSDISTLATATFLTQAGAVLAAGLLTTLTPCVYPLIPITLSIFGASAEVSRGRSLYLSACYVLGLALTYTILGSLSAWTGLLFGSLIANPLVLLLLVLLLIAMALHTLDIRELQFLSGLQTRAGQLGGRGPRGAFSMGLVSGLVAAPCVGPVLVLILGLAASGQDPLRGALLLFLYAVGLGLPFLLLAWFSGLLQKLPRSGNWLHTVKFVVAAALLLTALFLSQHYLGPLKELVQHLPFSVLTTTSAFSLLAAVISYRREYRILRFAAALFLAFAAFPLISTDGYSGDLRWHHNLESAVYQASSENRPVMVDMYADWCGACKELEMRTFSVPNVQDKLSEFVLVRIDLTIPSGYGDSISERFQVTGLPTLLFLSPDGEEIPRSRIEGFISAQDFLRELERIYTDRLQAYQPDSPSMK